MLPGLKERLLGLINDPAYTPLKKKELALIFDIHPTEMPMFYNFLEELEEDGYMFQANSDTEVILYILARYYKGDIVESLKITMDYIKGAYSLVIMGEDELVAVRDPHGFRPLVLGKKGDEYIFASENCAIDILGGEVIRDVEPGEIVTLDHHGIRSQFYAKTERHAMCAMEYVYFARPDSDIEGCNVHNYRKESGKILFHLYFFGFLKS